MADHIGKGHELYIDSYYTSVPIAVELSTQLSQYIENSMSSVVGSGTQCSPDVKQLITRTIGPHPIIQVTIGGVTVDCLVDSGSQVSMIEECFFKQHLRAKNLTDDGNECKEIIVEKVLFKDNYVDHVDHALLSSRSTFSKEQRGPISKQRASCSQAA